jgi:catechol 2,3-dioxygenase-like lactoylglutathione lyase family enzyme
VELFAGMTVSDYERAQDWYVRLLGAEPAFFPNDIEAVWEIAEHRYLYILASPEGAGGGLVTLFVDDVEALVAEIAARGIEPDESETYSNGVRKVTYHDPDGNEIGFGGGPT